MKRFRHTSPPPAQPVPHAVRATFSLPDSAITEIEDLRTELARRGVILNRSEVVRLGLTALRQLSEKELLRSVHELDRLKAGRPKG